MFNDKSPLAANLKSASDAIWRVFQCEVGLIALQGSVFKLMQIGEVSMSFYERFSTPLARKVLSITVAGLFLLNFSIFLKNQFKKESQPSTYFIAFDDHQLLYDFDTSLLERDAEHTLKVLRHKHWDRVRDKAHPELRFKRHHKGHNYIYEFKVTQDDVEKEILVQVQ